MRLNGLMLLLSLVLVAGGCSEEEGAPEEGQEGFPTARTEPAEFRQESLSDSLPLAAPEGDLGENSPVNATPEGKPAPFGIESARVVFRVTGDRSGKMIHEFRDYGRYNRQLDSTVPKDPNAVPGPIHELSITNPKVIGQYNHFAKSGWGIVNTSEKMLEDSTAGTNLSAFDLFVKQMNAKKLADTVINGYQTEVYRTESGPLVQTTWFWRHIPIRIHYFAPMEDLEWTYEPVSVEVNPEFPENHFLFTDDYNIRMQVAPPAPGLAPPPPALTDPRDQN